MAANDNLQRFLDAQAQDYPTALSEIRTGRKVSHWMWYIFPQLKGLGFSHAAQYYGIAGEAEATAYLAHPVLGARLVEISEALLTVKGSNATAVMGSPDDVKLRSSMTLFALVPGSNPVFGRVLDKFFDGVKDEMTVKLLRV